MNNNKVSFIICSNDELMKSECIWYINHLQVPEGMSVDVLAVDDASSMCSGYNLAMNSSDATYKVYLHHDVFILNPSFISDMIDAFESDPGLGILGVVGVKSGPANGSFYDHWDVGMVETIGKKGRYPLKLDTDFEGKVRKVDAVDGLCIMTRTDIPWREDVFDGFDFYDISQCIEMSKAGYGIGVVRQETPWCLHDSGISVLGAYDKYRQLFCECYSDRFTFDIPYTQNNSEKEFFATADMIAGKIDELLGLGQYSAVYTILPQLSNYAGAERKLDGLYNAFRICECLQGESTLAGMGSSVHEILDWIKSSKFIIRRMDISDQEAAETIDQAIAAGNLNQEAISILAKL